MVAQSSWWPKARLFPQHPGQTGRGAPPRRSRQPVAPEGWEMEERVQRPRPHSQPPPLGPATALRAGAKSVTDRGYQPHEPHRQPRRLHQRQAHPGPAPRGLRLRVGDEGGCVGGRGSRGWPRGTHQMVVGKPRAFRHVRRRWLGLRPPSRPVVLLPSVQSTVGPPLLLAEHHLVDHPLSAAARLAAMALGDYGGPRRRWGLRGCHAGGGGRGASEAGGHSLGSGGARGGS